MRYVRVGEADAAKLRSYFDVRLLDLQSPALAEAGGQPERSVNGGSFNPSGIGVLVPVSYGRYYAELSPGIVTIPSDLILTRYKSALTAESRGDTFVVLSNGGDLPEEDSRTASYGSVDGGDLHFANSLGGAAWRRRGYDEKRRALIDATRMVDRLNFAGERASDFQVLQFPRRNSYVDPVTARETATGDVRVPDDVTVATYLIADKLLDGWDQDIEADLLASASSRYQGASTMYNREYIPEHMRAGIPSARAWSLIRPYVRDPQEVEVARL